MHRNIWVLSLGLGALALSQFPVSIAHANTKKCEIVTKRTCDLKGNCKDETYDTCSGFSGAPGKSASPRNAPPRPSTKSLSK